MLVILLCICIGVILGMVTPIYIPASVMTYAALAILAGVDSVFGGIAAYINNNFRLSIFVTGFFGNTIIAVMLVYMGRLLNLDLYLAAVVVFAMRLFGNFAVTRRYLMSDTFRQRLHLSRTKAESAAPPKAD